MLKCAIALVVLMFVSNTAIACSTCMVGDPTLSLMGMEKPFADRFRISVDYLSRSEKIGVAGVNQKEIDEQRLSLSLAYSPSTRLTLGATLPFVKRQLDNYNLADQEVSAPGDLTLMMKTFWQPEESFQQQLYGMVGGLKLGTANEERDSQGMPLDFDVQAGQGADVINAGFWYAQFRFPYLFYGSANYYVASEGFQDFQAGDALVFNATAQYSPNYQLAWYLGIEGRTSEPDRFGGIEDPDSGGTILFLTPGIIYTLRPDLLINAVFKYPALDELNGNHEEGAIFSIGVTHDLYLH